MEKTDGFVLGSVGAHLRLLGEKVMVGQQLGVALPRFKRAIVKCGLRDQSWECCRRPLREKP